MQYSRLQTASSFALCASADRSGLYHGRRRSSAPRRLNSGLCSGICAAARAANSAGHQSRVAAGRHPEKRLEVPVEMALIGEAAGTGDFGQGHARGNQAARFRDPPRDEIAMRRRAEAAAKGAGEAEAIEAGDALEIG